MHRRAALHPADTLTASLCAGWSLGRRIHFSESLDVRSEGVNGTEAFIVCFYSKINAALLYC